MLNLTYFQSIFNEENTEIRCRKVLDEISPVLQPLFKRFVEKTGVNLGNEYIVKSYDSTLSTTYSDARNPAYAEKKKSSDIGRKYFVRLNRKIDKNEYNMLTLELDGLNRMIYIHSELNFIPFWAWVKSDKIQNVLQAVPDNFSIFLSWQEKKTIEKDNFVQFIKDCIKPRKRPWFQIGKTLPLEGQLEESFLINELTAAWENLTQFREYYNQEINVSKKAYDALMNLAAVRNINETRLLGRNYTLDISAIEDNKSNEKRQPFYLYDGDQLITKGLIYYYEYHDKNSPFQTIAVQLEGHNHIFTSAREILGTNTKEWWITKLFATHSLDNQEVMAYAMRLLREHDFKVNGNDYYVGSYDNQTQTFIDGADKVKKNFIDGALLFAHASKKGSA